MATEVSVPRGGERGGYGLVEHRESSFPHLCHSWRRVFAIVVDGCLYLCRLSTPRQGRPFPLAGADVLLRPKPRALYPTFYLRVIHPSHSALCLRLRSAEQAAYWDRALRNPAALHAPNTQHSAPPLPTSLPGPSNSPRSELCFTALALSTPSSFHTPPSTPHSAATPDSTTPVAATNHSNHSDNTRKSPHSLTHQPLSTHSEEQLRTAPSSVHLFRHHPNYLLLNPASEDQLRTLTDAPSSLSLAPVSHL